MPGDNYPAVKQYMGTHPRPFVPNGDGHESYIMPAGVVDLPIPTNARAILIQATAQNIRYTLDGTDPTPTRGFQMVASDPERLVTISSDTTLKFIAEVAGAVLQYTYGK